MIDITHYELTTYVARAACASGLTAGEATVLGDIVHDLFARGTECAGALLASFEALDEKRSGRPRVRIAAGVATFHAMNGRQVSAIIAACQIYDLLRSGAGYDIVLDPVDHPIFLAGSLTAAAKNGALASIIEAPTLGETAAITIRPGLADRPEPIAAAVRRVALPEPVWDTLQLRSARLYVPETVRSRRFGAGATAVEVSDA